MKKLIFSTALCLSLSLGGWAYANQTSTNGLGDLGAELDKQQQIYESKSETLAARLEAEMAAAEDAARAVAAAEATLKDAGRGSSKDRQVAKSLLAEAIAGQLAAAYRVVTTQEELLALAIGNLDALGSRLSARVRAEDSAKLERQLREYTTRAKAQADALEKASAEYEGNPSNHAAKALVTAMTASFEKVFSERQNLSRRLQNGERMAGVAGKVRQNKTVVVQALAQTMQLKKHIQTAAGQLKVMIEISKASTGIATTVGDVGGIGKVLRDFGGLVRKVESLLFGGAFDNDEITSELSDALYEVNNPVDVSEHIRLIRSQ